MPEIELWNDFSAGWCPSDDSLNGRRNGLPIMNNLELAPNGALNLTGGTVVIRTLAGTAIAIYSKTLSGTKLRYSVLSGGGIYRDGTLIATASITSLLAGFGAAYGYVFITVGNKRIADSGSGTPINLYIDAPATAPVHAGVAKATLLISGDYSSATTCALVNAEGTIITQVTAQVNVDSDTTTFRAVVESILAGGGPTGYIDATVLSGGVIGTEDDQVAFSFQCEEPSQLISVTVQFCQDESGAVPATTFVNYYEYTWVNDGTPTSPFNQGYNSYSTLQARRGDFARKGQGLTLPWRISSMKITITATTSQSFAFFRMYMNGGGTSKLVGDYQWTQVNVRKNGAFVTKSVQGPNSEPIRINGSAAQITPINPATGGGTEGWVFRRGGALGSTWYLTKVVTDATPFEDELSDDDLLEPGNVTIDPYMNSLAPTVLVDDIFANVGPIEGRMIYFTTKQIIFSEQNSPGTYSRQQTRDFSGELGEKFMWALQVGDNTVLVGTSKDVYRLDGTFLTLPDGFIDVYLTPLGIASPPIAYDVCRYGGGACYMSATGWRQTFPSGESRSLIGDRTDTLYHNLSTSAYVPAAIYPFGTARYSIAAVKDQLYCVVQVQDGTRRVEVYDFNRNYWREYNINPALLVREDDEELLGFWGDDSKLRSVNTVLPNKNLDGVTQQTVSLMSPRLFGGAIHNRKDVYTVKMNVYTNSSTCVLTLINDAGSPGNYAFSSSSLNTQVTIDVSALGPIKNWQYKIDGACGDFILRNISMEYDVRPPQLTYLRVPPTNYGVVGRKRLSAVPFTIDTMGNTVVLTPKKDNSNQTGLSFSTAYKQSKEYFFNTRTTGIDYEYIFSCASGVFEFFGFQEPKNMIALPEQVQYWSSQETNFGTNAQKTISSWTFSLACLGATVTATLYADGISVGTLSCGGTEETTYTMHFTGSTAPTGTDFYVTFSGTGNFEIHDPGFNENGVKFSYVSKKPSRLVQIGPIELFRYGKIEKFLVRVRTTTATLSVAFYLDNATTQFYTITTTPNVELVYEVYCPKTTGASILRVVIDAAAVFYYENTRMKYTVGGKDTEVIWGAPNAN